MNNKFDSPHDARRLGFVFADRLQAASTEFQALITADFVKLRDKVQQYGNRLTRKLAGFGKTALDALMDLPPEAGLRALETWHLEEKEGVYVALGRAPPPPPPDDDGGSARSVSGSVSVSVLSAVSTSGSDAPFEEDLRGANLTTQFLRHLNSSDVQLMAAEKRAANEPWLRVLGLRVRGGRRDEAVWKREIDRRIDVLLDKGTTPLQRKDFDFRVKRFLHEYSVHSTVARVSEALAHVEATTIGRGRNDVRSWPAYLATLLRRADPKLYEVLVERDRRARVDRRRDQGSESMADGDGCGARWLGHGGTDSTDEQVEALHGHAVGRKRLPCSPPLPFPSCLHFYLPLYMPRNLADPAVRGVASYHQFTTHCLLHE